MYKIEKNVEFNHVQGCAKYPFPEMEIDDSFYVEIEDLVKARAAAGAWGKAHGRKFSGQRHREGGRIWRIE